MQKCSVLSGKAGRGVLVSVLSWCLKSIGHLLRLAGRGSGEKRRSETQGRRLVPYTLVAGTLRDRCTCRFGDSCFAQIVQPGYVSPPGRIP
jgi:hypothetical protein